MSLSALLVGALLGGAAAAAIAWTIARARHAAEMSWMRDRHSATFTDIAARNIEHEQQLRTELSCANADLAAAAVRLEAADDRAATLASELQSRAAAIDELRAANAVLAEERATLVTRLQEEQKAAEEKLAVVRKAETSFREAFSSLSSDALQRNNQSFLELAKEALGTFQQQASGDLANRQLAIDEMVKPIRESLDKFDARIQDVERARVEAYATLGEQVKSLGISQQVLQSETSNLVRALRAPHVRGRWGELQLKRVVEMAGMLNYCDFREQQTVASEDGRLRPDVVVQLPGGKTVVVDAKAPLVAYLSSLEATDDAVRNEHLKDHARQVRDHITKLSSKQYWAQFQSAPELVIMFLPGETFFSAALQHDPSLLEFGVEQRVIVASPTTLIALLRAVAHGWNQERIQESAQAISALGRVLHDRLQTMVSHFEAVGRSLDRAVDAYNKTAGSFEARVLVQARRFGELGVTTSAEIPELPALDRTARSLQAQIFDEEREAEPEDLDAPPEFLAAEATG